MLTNIKTNFSQALLLQSFLVILLERNVIKFLVLDTQEIIVFRNVVFHETVFSFLQNSISPKSPNISTYLPTFVHDASHPTLDNSNISHRNDHVSIPFDMPQNHSPSSIPKFFFQLSFMQIM